MDPEITKGLLMELLLEDLGKRSMTLEECETAHGHIPGSAASALANKDEPASNRHIRIAAMYLGTPAEDLYKRLSDRADADRDA